MTPMTNVKLLATGVCLLVAQIASGQPPQPTEAARSVTLSLVEYNRLIDLAGRPAPDARVPPVAAVLASADLRVRVDADIVRGVFQLAGDVLRTGVNRVNLISSATLVAATTAGRPLPLVADGQVHAALLSGPGSFSVDLEWGARLALRPGRASFLLPVPAAGTAHATIDIPGDQADVRLSAGLVTRRTSAGGRTIVEATLDPGSATDVSWSLRDSAPVAAAREVRTTADVLTLLTIGDSDVRMVALVDVAVVQGEPRTIHVRLPAGYEVLGISGSSLETSEPRDGGVLLTIGDLAARRHQFLLSLERSHAAGSFGLDTECVTVPDAQRERGEIAIEGVGTLELGATERAGMHRIDVRELHRSLHSLARLPILSAFRYQRSAALAPGLSLAVERFPDAGVLAAVADRAVATTLVTTEGRALTELVLQIQNRAQPFLKVALPPGATMVSVEVAGQSAKPVLGADGTRVPLLRPGFRPAGTYEVSVVYLHAGTPFGRKGEMQMTLPRMDLPVGMISWEVFVPERYSVRRTGGNVIDAMTPWPLSKSQMAARRSQPSRDDKARADAGISDRTAAPDNRGIVGGVTGGVAAGRVGALAETDAVSGAAPRVNEIGQASQNVVNLQQRAAGVLPVRVDVPRAGSSHIFSKPLVIDQETTVSFRYRQR